MLIDDDPTRPALVHAARLDWVPSPAAGVRRKMLCREGDEVARATSIVRHAAGSALPPHVHSGGEEILVLEGTFQDEHADFPAGRHFRNPPGTSHSPASAEGCTVSARPWQRRQGDDVQVVRQPGEGRAVTARSGASTARVLFEDAAERVWDRGLAAGRLGDGREPSGTGVACALGARPTMNGEGLEAQGWGRLPAGQALTATVGPDGARVWFKDAPLQHPDVLPMPR